MSDESTVLLDENNMIGGVFILDSSFNYKALQRFTEMYNAVLSGQWDYCHIYLSSPGGDVSVCQVMVDMINLNRDKFCVTAFGQVCSAAFTFLMRVHCNCRILPNTIGMYHMSSIAINTTESGVPYGKQAKLLSSDFRSNIKKDGDLLMDILGFTDDEKVGVDNEEEVWFTYDRMLDFMSAKQDWLIDIQAQGGLWDGYLCG